MHNNCKILIHNTNTQSILNLPGLGKTTIDVSSTYAPEVSSSTVPHFTSGLEGSIPWYVDFIWATWSSVLDDVSRIWHFMVWSTHSKKRSELECLKSGCATNLYEPSKPILAPVNKAPLALTSKYGYFDTSKRIQTMDYLTLFSYSFIRTVSNSL